MEYCECFLALYERIYVYLMYTRCTSGEYLSTVRGIHIIAYIKWEIILDARKDRRENYEDCEIGQVPK